MRIQGTLTQSCGASDAKWDAYSVSQARAGGDFAGTTTADWPLPDGSGQIGHDAALPAGAVDGAGNPVPQARAGFAIKSGGRTRITGSRSGSDVYLRARVLRFNWSLNGGSRRLGSRRSTATWSSISRAMATGFASATWALVATGGLGRCLSGHRPGRRSTPMSFRPTTIWGASSRTIDRSAGACWPGRGALGWASTAAPGAITAATMSISGAAPTAMAQEPLPADRPGRSSWGHVPLAHTGSFLGDTTENGAVTGNLGHGVRVARRTGGSGTAF